MTYGCGFSNASRGRDSVCCGGIYLLRPSGDGLDGNLASTSSGACIRLRRTRLGPRTSGFRRLSCVPKTTSSFSCFNSPSNPSGPSSDISSLGRLGIRSAYGVGEGRGDGELFARERNEAPRGPTRGASHVGSAGGGISCAHASGSLVLLFASVLPGPNPGSIGIVAGVSSLSPILGGSVVATVASLLLVLRIPVLTLGLVLITAVLTLTTLPLVITTVLTLTALLLVLTAVVSILAVFLLVLISVFSVLLILVLRVIALVLAALVILLVVLAVPILFVVVLVSIVLVVLAVLLPL